MSFRQCYEQNMSFRQCYEQNMSFRHNQKARHITGTTEKNKQSKKI